MKMLLKFVFLSVFLFQMIGSVKTEIDYGCATGQTCPCCERNTCNKDRTCIIACKDGYWGGRCYHKCPSYCTRCGREFGNRNFPTYQKCYKCAARFYNGTGITNCSTPCPETCKRSLCDATTGSCLNGCINENTFGDMCDQCIKGTFGTNCSLSCPTNCNDSVCSRTEGKCVYGCKSNAFRGDKCNTCEVGKYGSDCDTSCPDNCENKLCFKSNGTCTKGCKGNFAGDVCTRCKDGYFGNYCTKPCPNSCLHGICNFMSGYCTECATGWFGSNCDIKCGKCKNETCHQYSSQCSYGCIDGYSGYNCVKEIEEKPTVTIIAAVVGSVGVVVVIAAMVSIGFWFLRRRKKQASRYQDQGQAYENTLMNIGSQRNYLLLLLNNLNSRSSVKTEMDKRCMMEGQTCPCCEGNKCDDNRQCMIACKDGYYGGRCYQKCPSYCTRCGREFGNRNFPTYQKCYKCAAGFYNGTGITNCSTPCPDTCNQTLCDATNGSCLNGCINANINGDKCDQCKKGKFGTNCSFSCPPNCKFSVCSRTEGKCTYGCVSNVFEGDKCNTCVVGKYGKHCDKTCPKNCRDNVCFKINGTCTAGCKGNFAGEVCNRCKDGYFCNDCTKPCPSSCLHGICNFTSGLCNECPTGWFGSNCDKQCPSNCLDGGCNIKTGLCKGCKQESFGSFCNITCSFGCKDRLCEQDSGVCLNNCNYNYFGDKCCVKSNNCITCSSTTECKVCNIGYYGYNCQNVCPSNCEKGCNIATGNCLTCKNNRYGERCNSSCSPFCKRVLDQNRCDSKNGNCVFGCIEGSFSSTCNKMCSSNCLDNRCTQDKGKCVGCYRGYYGDNYDKTCGKCMNGICHQNSSQCLNGCVGGYSGYDCMNEMEEESASNVIPAVVGNISAVAVIAVIVTIGLWIIRRRIIQASRYQERGQGYENTLVDIGLHDYQQQNTGDSTRENIYDIPSAKPVENEYANTAIN